MSALRAIGVRTALTAAGITGLLFLTGCDAPPRMIVPVAPTTPPPPEPLPACAGVSLEVAFLGPGDAAEIARGELRLDADDPDVGLEFASPYTIQVADGGANLDVPGLRPTIGVFVSNLDFSTLGEGFRQTMTLEWISELEARAGRPNCEPVSVSCDLQGCAGP